jgi:molybdate transport system ATP-binding protein
VGYVFQESALFAHTSVRGNLQYALKRTPVARRSHSVEQIAERTAITHLLDRGVPDLSGGERQRVAIARALLTRPRLLLLDEPLASVDRAGKAELLAFLDDLRRDLAVPVVYVTHLVEEVARLADQVLLFDAGRLVDRGPVADMLARLSLHAPVGQTSLAVIDAMISAHDPEYGIARMDFDGGRLEVPMTEPPATWSARLCVDAANVSLTRSRAEDSSILNRLPAVVEALDVLDAGHVLVRCRVGPTLVPALITRFSADRLALQVGEACVVQIKAVAIT